MMLILKRKKKHQKSYHADPEIKRKASKKAMIPILKTKRKHQKRLTKKTHKSVNKPLKRIIVSTERNM